MAADFFARFAAPAGDDPPLSFQLLYPGKLDLDADGLATVLRDWHPDFAGVGVDLRPPLPGLIADTGPPAAVLGLVEWGGHRVKLAGFDAPMPYGPVEACVRPSALLPPEVKADAVSHAAHVLLYYAGTHPDPLERLVALGAVSGALARFGAIVTLNEEARAAVPAFDLIPENGEDVLATLRGLPVPYLYGGFLRMDVGDPGRPWVRSFANHRLGLPDLAMWLTGYAETGRAFRLFDALLNYLRAEGQTFEPGDAIDLGDGKLRLRAPAEPEWYLDSVGAMLVIEPADET
ncbi:MAG: hypothetical protein U0871_22545 [Gemmataceae bacterium]